MFVVFRERVMPDGAESESEMVPEKPFTEPSKTVEVPEAPCWMLIVLGILVCVKSTTWIVNVTKRTRDPLVPVTTMEKVPVTEPALTVRVEELNPPAGTEMLEGVGALGPLDR
jgi:hypothetical protein